MYEIGYTCPCGTLLRVKRDVNSSARRSLSEAFERVPEHHMPSGGSCSLGNDLPCFDPNGRLPKPAPALAA